jgi:hypothetical protein
MQKVFIVGVWVLSACEGGAAPLPAAAESGETVTAVPSQEGLSLPFGASDQFTYKHTISKVRISHEASELVPATMNGADGPDGLRPVSRADYQYDGSRTFKLTHALRFLDGAPVPEGVRLRILYVPR